MLAGYLPCSVQEIYPPKAHDFAYVTDGACSVADLLDTELIICKVRDPAEIDVNSL